MSEDSRTNGFYIRTLNQDCDRLAVQSSVQGTWFCTYRGTAGKKPKKHEVGIAQKELIVLRPYQGKPVIELEGLGGPYGVLIVERANGGTTVLRNGRRQQFELDGALVVKTENFSPPGREGASIGAL
jgi:hypothetical protein